LPFLVGRSRTAATFQSRCACLPAALLVVCYPERCDELSRVGVYSHPWKYDARRAPTTNKSPPSRAARLVGSRIIEDHISVGQARNIANADKVCGAPLQRLAHMDAQRLACKKRGGVAHLPPCKEGRPKVRAPKKARSRYGPTPAAPVPHCCA
jgi:hypothetical protein